MMSRRFGHILLAALLPLTLQALPAAAEGVTAGERQAILDLHNKYRAQHCAPPLTWSNEIAAAAQRWADKCRFSHNTADKFGENLAWGGDRSIESAIDAWYGEVKNYNFARPGTSSGVGHFTQIVWKNTRQIGCGVSKCFLGTVRYWVCQYSPQANWEGQFGANVLPRCEAQPKAAAKPASPAPAIR